MKDYDTHVKFMVAMHIGMAKKLLKMCDLDLGQLIKLHLKVLTTLVIITV